ncbi:MAG: N-6 DNA methylase [Bacteroidetes bacterium]|nr:N-6 DNA methylase [Bacteroidota bacterium]
MQPEYIARAYQAKNHQYISNIVQKAGVHYLDILSADKTLYNQVVEELSRLDIFDLDKLDRDQYKELALALSFLITTKYIVYILIQKESNHPALQKISESNDIQRSFTALKKAGFGHVYTLFNPFLLQNKKLSLPLRLTQKLEKITKVDFKTDILGTIYNNLFKNQQQTEKGQHFTSNDEIDIINTFCIKPKTKSIIDTACGSGAFLVRAFQRLKHLHLKAKPENLKGIDVAQIPVFLARMNMLIQDIYNPKISNSIILKDFVTIHSNNSSFSTPFDACIGNPPYIRQELIKNKEKWVQLIKADFGIQKINKQSDLYIYYLMHTASLLKEGGRLGYVIASSWMDVSYGKDLQKFLLGHFKIIAIIDQQSTRSFQTASVNTVILIIEKCCQKEERESNKVKFVRLNEPYNNFIGTVEDTDRLDNLEGFVQQIEQASKNIKSKIISIHTINQRELELNSSENNKYHNGYWGTQFFRTTPLYQEIIQKAKSKLIPLKALCDVKYGIKTGANSFFYLTDETDQAIVAGEKNSEFWSVYGKYRSAMDKKHYIIERSLVKPILKSQREAQGLSVNSSDLKYCVLDVKYNRSKLKNSKSDIYKYIQKAESSAYKIHQRPTCKARVSADKSTDWFNLGKEIIPGDFIIPSKIGERFRLLDNRTKRVYCDKVNYKILIKPEFAEYGDILFATLNSTLFRHLIDLFARQLTGSQTLSDVDVHVIQNTLIPHPKYLVGKEKELNTCMRSMCERKQESIFEEIHLDDRKKLDNLIMESLGFDDKHTDQLHNDAVRLVRDRKVKSESVKTIKRPVKKR